MGRDPYVPREVMDSGRYRPAGRVRVVDYPDPYPIRANKVVTIADVNCHSFCHPFDMERPDRSRDAP